MKKRRVTKIRPSPYAQCQRCAHRLELTLATRVYIFCPACYFYEWA